MSLYIALWMLFVMVVLTRAAENQAKLSKAGMCGVQWSNMIKAREANRISTKLPAYEDDYVLADEKNDASIWLGFDCVENRLHHTHCRVRQKPEDKSKPDIVTYLPVSKYLKQIKRGIIYFACVKELTFTDPPKAAIRVKGGRPTDLQECPRREGCDGSHACPWCGIKDEDIVKDAGCRSDWLRLQDGKEIHESTGGLGFNIAEAPRLQGNQAGMYGKFRCENGKLVLEKCHTLWSPQSFKPGQLFLHRQQYLACPKSLKLESADDIKNAPNKFIGAISKENAALDGYKQAVPRGFSTECIDQWEQAIDRGNKNYLLDGSVQITPLYKRQEEVVFAEYECEDDKLKMVSCEEYTFGSKAKTCLKKKSGLSVFQCKL